MSNSHYSEKKVHIAFFASLILLLSGLFFMTPASIHAQDPVDMGSTAGDPVDIKSVGGDSVDPGSVKGTSAGGTTGTKSLINPLKCTPGAQAKGQCIPEFLTEIIEVLLIFALPIIILYIMYAGFLFVTAAGNSEQISTARTALLWAVVGGVIVLGAKIIIDVIQGTISGLK